MDIGIILNAMRDPAGVPAHPSVFQALMIITWIPHILFVHITLGCAGVAIAGFHARHRNAHWVRLSVAMTKAAKVGVSLLIVLGVAPLLFTQVIYDPQWYVANLLSARWTIAFIFTLIVAYCAWFVFYCANRAGAKRHIGLYAWLAIALFCLDGLIMHALSYQALLPAEWMSWYAPNGAVDTRGALLHAIQWPRYAFFMGLAAPVTGLFLVAYTHYFGSRADFPRDYLAFVATLGTKLARYGFAVSLLPLVAWQLSHAAGLGLTAHPVGWLLAAEVAAMAFYSRRIDAAAHGYRPLLGVLAILALLAVWREVIRARHLAPFGYDVATYPVHVDWPSTLLFFSTLLGIGGMVGGFYLTVLYRAGRVQGVFTADRTVVRLGTGAVAILALWIAIFFAYGIVIWVGNNFS